MKNMGSIILNLFIVDPWTTWVWTMKVHLYADFCQEIYSRLSISTGSTSMEKEGQLWDFASLGTWGGFWNQSPKIPPRDDCIYWSNSLWLTSLLLPLPPPPWSCDCLSYPTWTVTTHAKSLSTWTRVLTLLAFWLLTWENPFTLWLSSCRLTFRSCSGPHFIKNRSLSMHFENILCDEMESLH